MSRLAPILVVALLAASCGGGGASSEALAALNGDWLLTSGTGPSGEVDLTGGVEATLTIEAEDWGGQVCNHYGAETVELSEGTVTIGGVFQTEMACQAAGWMEAEAAYLAAFQEVEAYEVTADELRLTGDGVELVYAPVDAAPVPELIGTVWVLDTLIEGSGPDGTASSTTGDEEATLELREDGAIVASSGCLTREDDGSTYEVDGQRLVTTFTTEYDYDCPDDAAWAQDEHVWQVIERDPEFAIDGQRLTLTAGELGLAYLPRE